MRLWQLRVLFKQQIYAAFQEDEAAMSPIPFFGDGHLLWTSDYPHPDSVAHRNRAPDEASVARGAAEAHARQGGEALRARVSSERGISVGASFETPPNGGSSG